MAEEEDGTKHSNGDQNDIVSWFEAVSESAPAVQRQTLRRILEANWGVDYLKKWFSDTRIQDLDESELELLYTRLVPLSTHADLEPFIQRLADGDSAPLLTRNPIDTLSLSSGTTEGRQKYVPFTNHSAQTTLQIFRLAAAYRSRAYPTREGGRILEFIYSSKQYKTKGGLTVGTATTHYYNSPEFKIKQEKTKAFTCSLPEVISSGDYRQSTYCHLLLGLVFSEQVEFVTSTFAYTLVHAFTAFEDLWPDLCADISLGRASIASPEARQAVLRVFSAPNPSLAARVGAKCEALRGSDWAGLVPRLWPNAKYVYSIMTGSMEPYLKKLRHYAGDLPLVSADYGSTESWIGVNLEPCLPPERVTFAVVPTFSYFEFIPVYRRKKGCDSEEFLVSDDFVEEEPIPLSQVKVGQEYEIVLTTFTGLYRCRLGDVVEVTGFHNGTPKLSFLCRRKLILTLNIDKNTEKDLQTVVERASELLARKAKAELVDFTSHADMASHPVGHYVVYWEVKGEANEAVLGECCTEMDKSFVDHGYVVSRRAKTIGPLELRLVKRGTFRKILDHFIANGAALSQFKTPRCTSNKVILGILDLGTVSRFHSTAYR